MSNRYDKMDDFIHSIFNVFQMVNRKASQQQDQKMKIISLVIYNYARHLSKTYDVDLKSIEEPERINLMPIFEYIEANNIQLYDFSKIQMNDVDISKEADLERFVLTHIYYLTQRQ